MFGSEVVDPVSSHDGVFSVPSPGADHVPHGAGVLLPLLDHVCRDIVEGKSPSTLRHGLQTFWHRPAHPTSLSCYLIPMFSPCPRVASVMSYQGGRGRYAVDGGVTQVTRGLPSPPPVCCSSENLSSCLLESAMRLFRPVNKDPCLFIPINCSGGWKNEWIFVRN